MALIRGREICHDVVTGKIIVLAPFISASSIANRLSTRKPVTVPSYSMERIQEVNREMGTTVLIVEQKVREVLGIAGRVYGVRMGRVAFSGRADELSGQRLRGLFL